MATLVTTDEVFAALGLNSDQMADAVPQYEGAIRRATIEVQNILDTTFDPQAVVETFMVDLAQCGGPLNGYYRFKLSNGWLFLGVVIELAATPDGPFTTATGAFAHMTKGIIYVPELQVSGAPLEGLFVRVTYNSGFRSKTEAPKQIRDAILSFVPQMLLSVRSVAADAATEANETKKANSAAAIATNSLIRIQRDTGAVNRPFSTVSSVYSA